MELEVLVGALYPRHTILMFFTLRFCQLWVVQHWASQRREFSVDKHSRTLYTERQSLLPLANWIRSDADDQRRLSHVFYTRKLEKDYETRKKYHHQHLKSSDLLMDVMSVLSTHFSYRRLCTATVAANMQEVWGVWHCVSLVSDRKFN